MRVCAPSFYVLWSAGDRVPLGSVSRLQAGERRDVSVVAWPIPGDGRLVSRDNCLRLVEAGH